MELDQVSHERQQVNIVRAVYVLEISEKPTLAFEATSYNEARSLTKEDWLREELARLQSNGLPVWDGQAKLIVRRAEEAEKQVFTEASENGQSSDVDELFFVYLVELDGDE